MNDSPKKDIRLTDGLEEAKRIMERLVKMPHKLHKDEPPRPHKGEPKVRPKRDRPKT